MPCCGNYETAAPWWNDWRYCAQRRLMCRPGDEPIPAWQLTQPTPPTGAATTQPGSDRAKVDGMAEKQTETVTSATGKPTSYDKPIVTEIKDEPKSGAKSDAKAAETKAEAKSGEVIDLTCTCGQKVSTEDAAEKHREKCTGQWLAEAEQVKA